jgi:Zn-dependent protease with chaperone function
MTIYPAGFSDGTTAARHEASVTVRSDGLTIALADGGAMYDWPYADLRAQTEIQPHSTTAVLTSMGAPGSTIVLKDAAAIALIARAAPHLTTRAARWSALKPGLAVGAVALAIGTAVWALNLSPVRAIAAAMPDRARIALGEAALGGMIGDMRQCNDPKGLAALRKIHDRLQPGRSTLTAVTVVDWSLTNAFAVPGGRVVLTRAILEKASSPDEVAGVLAHELGHGLERHPEQGLVRGVGFWAALQMLFTGSPGAFGNIGAALAQLSYSRDAEREADQRALDLLKAAEISPKPFAGFFKKVDKIPPTTTRGRMMRANDLFSSHPQSAERIAKIEAVADYPSRRSLSDDEWADLRKICGPTSAK